MFAIVINQKIEQIFPSIEFRKVKTFCMNPAYTHNSVLRRSLLVLNMPASQTTQTVPESEAKQKKHNKKASERDKKSL